MSARTSEPKCDRCQTPMERYAVPGTGGKEQAWRLACPCQHSATPDVARASKKRSMIAIMALSETVGRVAREQKSYRTETIKDLTEAAAFLAELADGMKSLSDETSDDLLYRIHRELARGHSSAALAVLAAALEHRALPACTACDVVTLAHNAQKASE